MKRALAFVFAVISLVAVWQVAAEDSRATSGSSPHRGRNIGEFITPDGRIDLNVVKESGYQGNLDLDEYEMHIDPGTGEPRFSPAGPSGAGDHPDDIYWDNSISPSIPGVNGIVHAITVFDGQLVIGGSFTVAGSIMVNDIASWDGSSWSSLGSGMGEYSRVIALTVYDNKLIAGGAFTTAGGVSARNIASWDGSSWSALGSGMSSGEYGGTVLALTVYDNKLIAGGMFTTAGGNSARRIASWDGSSWSSLGAGMAGGVSIRVSALTVYDSKLIAGGAFTTAGGVSARRIATWDGSSWSSLGSGIGDYGWIYALTVYDNKLIAGGYFTTAGGNSANNIASWNGSYWSSMGSGMDHYVQAVSVYDNKLIAGGMFTTAGSNSASRIASWDGSSWSSMGSGAGGYGWVNALIVYENKLIAGGGAGSYPGISSSLLASWDGSSWDYALGSGTNSWVLDLTVYDDKLIAGGAFKTTGGVSANYIASWDGSSWSALGSGMSGGEYGGTVLALTVYDNQLIAGGYFTIAGGISANCIASWDGSSWSALGSGMSGEENVWVNALTVYDNKLIAGGVFTTAGGVNANHIASWDSSSWSALGTGVISLGDYMGVDALTVYDNKLIAGGCFTTAGGISASYIASWDGSSWSALGLGMSYRVYALTNYGSKLIAGGAFKTAGGDSTRGIASWNGSSWSAVGSGMGGYGDVHALTVYGNQLIAGGCFTTAGGDSASRIASWDGSSWSAMGSGVTSLGSYVGVDALTVYDSELIAGGEFTTAGGKVSGYLAQWTKMDRAVFEPDPAYIYYKFAFVPKHAAIYVGNFVGDFSASDVVDAEVEGVPATITGILPSYPGFEGEVLQLDIPIAPFLEDYGAPLDTTSHNITVTGTFTDQSTFGAVGEVDLIGKSSASGGRQWILPPDEVVLHGDVDATGYIDIDDATTIIAVIFQGSSFFGPLMIADCNCSHTVDIDDIVYLINYIFGGGNAAGDPDGDAVPDC